MKNHLGWTDDQCRSIIWSDESKFMPGGHAGTSRVIRKKGTRCNAANIVQKNKVGVLAVSWFGDVFGVADLAR